MTLRIRKLVWPQITGEVVEHYAEGIADDDIGHTETMLLIEAPARRKNRFSEMFSSPVNKKLLKCSSETAQQVSTGMTALLFTQVRPPTDQILIERISKCLSNIFTAITGKPNLWDTFGNAVKICLFALYLVLVYFYERHDDSRLGAWKFILPPIIIYLAYRYQHTFCGLRIYDRFREDTARKTQISDHPLANLPLNEISQLGSTLFKGGFPYRITIEELLNGRLKLTSRLKILFRFPVNKGKIQRSGSFANASKTLLTVRPAIIDSYKNVLALIAIPDDCPEGGILILPEPEDIDKVTDQILRFTEVPAAQESGNEPVVREQPDQVYTAEPECDPTTLIFIERETSPELLRKWSNREAKAVAFYKKYDELKQTHPDWSINEAVLSIYTQDTSKDKVSVRHLKTNLTEREAREAFFHQYHNIRRKFPDIHPEETAKEIAMNCDKKTVRDYILDVRKLLCIGAHYAEFFRMADELKSKQSLNWLQVSRKIQNGDPKRFPFHPSVYHYHLLQRNSGNGSWQSKLL